MKKIELDLLRTLKNILRDEEAALHWWKNSMYDFDGEHAMREHHTKNIRRIKNVLKKHRLENFDEETIKKLLKTK